MITFVVLLLTVVSFAFVVWPFFKLRSRSVEPVEDERWQELQSQRDTTYSMLKELEFDFQSGVLTEEDYRDLEARYKNKAITILRDMDEATEGTVGIGIEEEIEKEVLALRQKRERFCTQCGDRVDEGDRFCAHCGARLRQGGRLS